MEHMDESRRTNVLLEDIRREVRSSNEGWRGLRSTVDSMDKALSDVGHDVKRLTDLTNGLTRKVDGLTGKVDDLTDRVDSIDTRLASLETKPA